jgi:hypothetical protein
MTGLPILKSDAMKVYAAVGQALCTWASAESALTLIFYTLAGNKTRQQAAAIMDSIISFDTRIDVLDALYTLKNASEEDAEIWRKLIARCRKLYKKRHKLAHFRLIVTQTKTGRNIPEIAPFFSYENWLNGKLLSLSLAEIEQLNAQFDELHDALLWILERLVSKRRKGKFAQDGEDPPPIAHLRSLARQSLLERQKQPQSIAP